MDLITVLGVVLAFASVLFFLVYLLFFKRANKQMSFVRTGMGGEKVVINSGTMVLPLFHNMIRVNMKTIEIPISRSAERSLITKDHLRVDIKANYFVRVETESRDVALAAQTMGNDTFDEDKVIDMFEERCEAALNAVVSKMTMDELHIQKDHFREEIESFMHNDLASNGLILQSVALTHVDQTDLQYFQETGNVFDSQGLTMLKEQIAKDEKKRVEVETQKEIEIRELQYEAEKNAIDYDKQLVQEQEERRKEINQIKQETEKEIEHARISKERDVELFQQKKSEAIADGQKKVAEIWIETDKLKAIAAKTSEEVTTAREQAQADRNRIVEVISAEKEADRQRIIAEAGADAEAFAAKAAELRYQVEAAGKRAINEAANLLSNQQIDMKVKMEIVKQLPDIVKESVKPLENIDGIKIMQLDGLNGVGGGQGQANGGGTGGSNGGGNGGMGGGSLSDQIVDSALRYKAHAPIVDGLLKEIGIDGASINSISKALKDEVSIDDKKDSGKGELKESA